MTLVCLLGHGTWPHTNHTPVPPTTLPPLELRSRLSSPLTPPSLTSCPRPGLPQPFVGAELYPLVVLSVPTEGAGEAGSGAVGGFGARPRGAAAGDGADGDGAAGAKALLVLWNRTA